MHRHNLLLHSKHTSHQLLTRPQPYKTPPRPTTVRSKCTADRQQAPSSSNGSKPQQQQQQQQQDDPVTAMLWAAHQDGVQVVFEDDADELEDLEDVLEDLEDPWMRNPSPPEWSESPLFAVPGDSGSSNSASNRATTVTAAATADSDINITPSSHFATVSWQELEQLVQQQEQEQEQQQPRVVLLEVKCPDGQQQQQQQCRPLPEPLPWLSAQQQQQQLLQPEQIQRVTLDPSAITRETAAEWQQQGAVVAVWDSGHHSCLAAAIRLSAVYRLPHVVLLQQQ